MPNKFAPFNKPEPKPVIVTIKNGDKIMHRDGDWVAHISSVNEKDNEISMTIRTATGGSWAEDWNLAHTESGLKRGEYVFV